MPEHSIQTDSGPSDGAGNPPIRVLAWPARRKRLENPYSYLVQASTAEYGVETFEFGLRSLLKLGAWDVIHIHWPDMVLLRKGRIFQVAAATAILALLVIQRVCGAKLVWTVHNLKPHEQLYPAIGRLYMSCFAGMVDGLLSPSQFGLDRIYEVFPRLERLPAAVTPIGHYRDEYGDLPDRVSARTHHGWEPDEYIILSFGLVRKYKNLPRLVEQVKELDSSKVRLVIAGPVPDESEKHQLESAASGDERIALHLGYIDQDAVPGYFAAADLVALPFKNILNSSSALLALSCNRQVLAPSIGAIPELASAVGGSWVSTYEGDITAEIIAGAMTDKPSSPEPDLSEFEWSVIGKKTSDLFRSLK